MAAPLSQTEVYSYLQRAVVRLRDPDLSAEDLAKEWSELCRICEENAENPPYHLAVLFDRIEAYRGDRPRSEIRILDHGCGGGTSSIYLVARGYTEVFGVDVNDNLAETFDANNRIFRSLLGRGDNHYFVYSGETLAYDDNFFDVIFSQQVIEHVADEVVCNYYQEESRTLKPGGIAVHQVPHRLTPYESHSRTWFLHYLPKPVEHRVFKLFGWEITEGLYLRMPSYHWSMITKEIGPSQDLTLERLGATKNPDYYDGPVALRRVVTILIDLPLLGNMFGAVLKHLAMIETISTKPR